MKARDLFGKIFGSLTAVSRDFGRKNAVYWNCLCECGEKSCVTRSNLVSGATKSCGCLSKKMSSERLRTHGMTLTRPFKIWDGIKQRCLNPKHLKYSSYGGRGITLPEKWLTFDGFWEDMQEGYRDDLTIDRIDNNIGYSKENCRWASMLVQSNNKRNNRFLEFDGKKLTVAQWARETGIKSVTIRARLQKGFNVEEALTMPVSPNGLLARRAA